MQNCLYVYFNCTMLKQTYLGKMQSARKVSVDLFYDVLSPYSYLGYELLSRCDRKWSNMDLKLKPVWIAGIMGASNNKPPGSVPAKANYMTKDLISLAKYYDMPFRFPADVGQVMFVKGSLTTQRLVTAVNMKCPENLDRVSRELFARIWVRDEDITTPESLLAACLKSGLGENEANELVTSIKSDEVKSKLKEATQAAIDCGAFGVPTFVAHFDSGPEMFFGTDRIFMLAHKLNQKYDGPFNELNQSKI